MAAVKSFVQYVVQQQQGIADFVLKKVVGQSEVVLVIQYIQVFDYALVSDIPSGKAHYLVEYG